MKNLTVAAVKAALDRCGGSKAEAARELRVSRQTLYNFMEAAPELQEYASEISETIAMAAILPTAIRRGRIDPRDRQELQQIIARCLESEARAA
ncbi:MAG: hypothetical protein EOS36_14900 [Mesorhizobium sp.]|uniref:helix-turn-helix domain-containing protein n=1 Tax=Mesorhizobium sp. TaxID=1871066 RepID=UPI000FEA46B6|nr:helix-turn-helix domain-containing protein [Mesorhizobium sp.]RWD62549.1 MAG: hypothetical protein EOS36_14900 [Mesorhizobium sp.]RWE39608.1 MAG: hypothetical protein EOS79_20505 [Mesorhizobium sp.]